MHVGALHGAQLGIVADQQDQELQSVSESSLFDQRLLSPAGNNQRTPEEFTLNETNPLERCDQSILWDLKKRYYLLC